jgi:hypothetical protein
MNQVNFGVLMGSCLVLVLLYIWKRQQDYSYDDLYVLSQLKDRLSVLDSRIKSLQIYPHNSTYTLNKKTIYVCLKDDTGKYYSDNMLVRVLLHELAHSFYQGDSSDHPSDWQEQYQQLLKIATKKGLFDPTEPPVANYCGIN